MTDQDAGAGATAAGTFTLGEDLVVNRLGFGAMRLTGRGILGEPENPEEACRVLRRAVELSVNLIDTADSYGPEISERLVAEALHPYPEDLVIATKGGFTRPRGRWVPDGHPEHLREACEGSLRRLKVNHIDLYQLHTPDPKIAFEDSVWALALLREEGKIRHVGLSNVGVRELEIAIDIVPIASVQNRYNLSDRSSEAVLQACEREEVGFIPWYPLAKGRLARPGGPLDEIAARHDATPSQVALAWLLKHSPAMLPIPGTSSVSHLEENVAAAALELMDEEMAALERTLKETKQERRDRRLEEDRSHRVPSRRLRGVRRSGRRRVAGPQAGGGSRLPRRVRAGRRSRRASRRERLCLGTAAPRRLVPRCLTVPRGAGPLRSR
jgi:pyridoxine 4-dehydrogenase